MQTQAGSSEGIISLDRHSRTDTSSTSSTDNDTDNVGIGRIYTPCFGDVDLKSYVDARMYGLSFRRMHDEWVALGRPHLDTSHWPRMPGHRGLPTSPESFISVANYYDRKMFEQVLLEVQGKPANRNRPLDDFIVSMVTTIAIVNADLVFYRLVRDQPHATEALTQSTWHYQFNTFMHDSILHFVNERKVCDRLGSHQCVIPLMFGQATSMSLPTLSESFEYQVQIFQNLFPNFGDHLRRCAAAAQASQRWTQSSSFSATHELGATTGSDRGFSNDRLSSGLSGSSGTGQKFLGDDQRGLHGHQARNMVATGGQGAQQSESSSSAPLAVTTIPSEIKRRTDLFVASISPAIRCDVPLEKVKSLLDSSQPISTSRSTSSASTPPSITATTHLHMARDSSGISSRTSFPSSDAEWPARRTSGSAVDGAGADIDSVNLTLRPPLHSHTPWPENLPRRSTSEEHSMITPEEAMAASQGRAHSNSVYSYFSSLPSTPTELLSPNALMPAQEGSRPYTDHKTLRTSISTGGLPMTSPVDPDSRKRTRAEQNREKMKAYHRRVMQQREALTSILTDMSTHVGPMTMLSAGTGAGTHPSMGTVDVTSGAGTSSSTGRSTHEQSWSVSLRNKQKQESKARLRRREIDQVRDLAVYANSAAATLTRATEAEHNVHITHAILRVFQRHRPSWVALISAEQRLASELTKISPTTEEPQGPQIEAREGDSRTGIGAGKGIKGLIDRIQMEERAGTLAVGAPESQARFSGAIVYDHLNPVARRSINVGGPGSFMGAGGGGALRAATAQSYQGPYSQTSFLETGNMVLSPDTSDYGAISPSGATRPMSGEDGAGYFNQERRRYGGRYSVSSDTGTSVLSMSMSSSYDYDHPSAQSARNTGASGGHRSGASGSEMPPSVLAPNAANIGYGNQVMYRGEGLEPWVGAQELQRQTQAQASMADTHQGQAGTSTQGMQLRMSTAYDGRNYGQIMMQGAPPSRPEQIPAVYGVHQSQEALYEYSDAPAQIRVQAGAPAPNTTQSGMAAHGSQPVSGSVGQYRAGQATSPQYTPHQQQPYGQ